METSIKDYARQQIQRLDHLMRSPSYADLPFELREQVFAFRAYMAATVEDLDMKMRHLQGQVQQLEARVELMPTTFAVSPEPASSEDGTAK